MNRVALYYSFCRWHPATLLRPTAFSPAVAHAVRPAQQPEGKQQNAGASGKQQKGKQQNATGQGRLTVVVDLPAALAQMHALGAGLAQDVLLCSGSQGAQYPI